MGRPRPRPGARRPPCRSGPADVVDDDRGALAGQRSASSRPMPRPAPVTMATLPSSSPMVFLSLASSRPGCTRAAARRRYHAARQHGRCVGVRARSPRASSVEPLGHHLPDQGRGLGPGPGRRRTASARLTTSTPAGGAAAAPVGRRRRCTSTGHRPAAWVNTPPSTLPTNEGGSRWPSPVTTRSARPRRRPDRPARPRGRTRARGGRRGRPARRPALRPPPRPGRASTSTPKSRR